MVNEDILRLKISIDEVLAVKILEAEYHLSCIEPCKWNVKLTLLLNETIELSTINALHHHVEGTVVLLDRLHADNQWMSQLLLQRELIVNMIHLLCLYDCLLRENLDRT